MDDELQEIIHDFLDESGIYLDQLNSILLVIEEDIAAGNRDDLDTMYRAAHSLKGLSAALGYSNVNKLTHEIENIFDEVRNGKMKFIPAIIDVLFGSFDLLSALVAEISLAGNDNLDIAVTLKDLQEVLTKGHQETGKDVEPDMTDAELEEAIAQVKEQIPLSDKNPVANEPVPVSVTEESIEVAVVEESESTGSGNSKYLQLFLQETLEELEQLQDGLLVLEGDRDNREILDEVFRMAHRIKGSSGSMGFDKMCQVTHHMESVFDALRDGELTVNDSMISLLLETTDVLRNFRAYYGGEEDHPTTVEAITKSLSDLLQTPPTTELVDLPVADWTFPIVLDDIEQKSFEKYEEAGMSLFQVSLCFQCDPGMRGIRAYLAWNRVSQVGEILKSEPKEEQFESEDIPAMFHFILASRESKRIIENMVSMDEVSGVRIEELHVKQQDETPDTAQVVAAQETTSEESVDSTVASTPAAEPETSAKEKKAAAATAQKGNQTLRVDSNRIDLVMNLASELVISKARFVSLVRELEGGFSDSQRSNDSLARTRDLMTDMKSMLNNGADKTEIKHNATEACKEIDLVSEEYQKMQVMQKTMSQLSEAVHQLERISTAIQSGIMSTRMVSIGPLFNRYRRVIRDLAKRKNMTIQLDIAGEGTELDKNLIDEISDPLTHIVRNAVDHGIETPDIRVEAGKPKEGSLRLSAYYSGSYICIEVQDDGKGLDLDALTDKAISKGLMDEAEVAAMSEEEKMDLIFHPGFSTAAVVTDISGRGMGMDIVKRKIDSMKGKLKIRSEKGKGATFTITVPLTLAIIKAILCKIHEDVFAIPIESVQEIIQVSQDDITNIQGNATIMLRGQCIWMVTLDRILESDESVIKIDGSQTAVIVGMYGKKVGILVDEVIGEDDIVVKSLQENMRHVSGLSGASIMGDGTVSLILDVQYFLERVA